MRVVWDARVLCGRELRGIGTYVANLLPAMHDLRPDLDIRLFSDVAPPRDRHFDGPTPRVVWPTQGYRWQLWERFVLPLHAKRAGAQLLHSPANTTPSLSVVPRVVTVHDVIPYLPEVAGEQPQGEYWVRTVPQAVRSAAAVLTVSEASRKDIARVFGIAHDRITVAHNAVGADVEPSADVQSALRRHDIRMPYILSLAATAHRKNTLGVLRVFARVAGEHRDVQLVLTGVGPDLRPQLLNAMRDLDIAPGRVRLLEFVKPAERNSLYTGALVFVFLSLYEGFGLPILEAMRCGTPVLSSNRGSCSEVAGDAALVVDPEDEKTAADRLSTMLGASTAEREEWRRRGFAREKQFTWKQAAEMTLGVYDRVSG